MASTWVCLVLVFRQGCGFSRAGLEWRGNETQEYWGGGGRPLGLLCLLQSPAEEILTGASMKPFAHELHKFPDISSWSSPKNCWRKASCLGCLASSDKENVPSSQGHPGQEAVCCLEKWDGVKFCVGPWVTPKSSPLGPEPTHYI